MQVYTYSEARQKLSAVLDRAESSRDELVDLVRGERSRTRGGKLRR